VLCRGGEQSVDVPKRGQGKRRTQVDLAKLLVKKFREWTPALKKPLRGKSTWGTETPKKKRPFDGKKDASENEHKRRKSLSEGEKQEN